MNPASCKLDLVLNNKKKDEEDLKRIERMKDGKKLENGDLERITEGIAKIFKDEVSHFSDLFTNVLAIILEKIPVTDEGVKEAYEGFFKRKFPFFQWSDINLSKPENLIAYFYAYSVISTDFTRKRFQDAFEKCQELQEGVKSPQLKIVSLGGGPGTDLIGFCSVLQEYRAESLQSLDLTVVDMWKNWEEIYNVTMNQLIEGSYGNVSMLFKNRSITTSFIEQDMRERKSERYVSDLQTADIVILARVLDSYNFRKMNPQDMLKGIVSGMKKGAFLCVIDGVVKEYGSFEVSHVYRSYLTSHSVPAIQKKRFLFDPSKQTKAQLFVVKKN